MSMRSVFGLEALGISGRVLRKTALAICLALKSLVVLAMITHASAQAPGATEDINDTTVGIVSGTVTGTYVQFASDLSNVLDDPGKMRVLALLGKGSMQNVEDILKVRGVDLGIVQSDVLAYIRKRGLFPGAVNKLQYVTKLYNEEFHLLTGTDINTIEDLRGRKVNFGLPGSGIAITASTVFDLLKIEVEAVHDDPAVALEKLKRGEIAASVGVYGKPAKIYDGLKKTDNVKFLPMAPTLELTDVYFPSVLTSDDYPELIEPGQTVETIAVGAVMIVYGWEPNTWRYNKVAKFVDMFFSNIEQLQKPPRHRKWQEVNLLTKVPGWQRFPAAQTWLERAEKTGTLGGKPEGAEVVAFRKFVADRSPTDADNSVNAAAREKMLQAFRAWKASRATQ